MEITATVTSKGQITLPAEVRKALGLRPGDPILFRLVDGHALFQIEGASGKGTPSVQLQKIPDFFDLAGNVPVPPGVDPSDWPAQRAAAWDAVL